MLRRLLIACLLVITPATVNAVPASAASASPTFISYNIRNCCNSDDSLLTSHTWDERRSKVANVLAETGGDVIALQEATPFNSVTGRKGDPDTYPVTYLLAKLQKLHPEKDYRRATTLGTPRAIIYSAAEFTKIEKVGTVEIPEIAGHGRMVLLEHKSTKKRIMVGNIHLPVSKPGFARNAPESEEHRREELRTLVRAMRPLANTYAKGRAIYLGDMNTWPGRSLTRDQSMSYAAGKMMAAADIPDASAICDACGTTKYSSLNGFKPRAAGPIMDRAFVRDVPVVRWRVMSEMSYAASDHFPIKVQLAF